MGTTLTALALIRDRRRPVGRRRRAARPRQRRRLAAYLQRDGVLRRATIDHSYVQELVATGHITEDEARTHPRRNIVTRALGIEPQVRVDTWTLRLVRGDRYVLCSDGLVDEVDDAEIRTCSAGSRIRRRPPSSWSPWPTRTAGATTSRSSSSTCSTAPSRATCAPQRTPGTTTRRRTTPDDEADERARRRPGDARRRAGAGDRGPRRPRRDRLDDDGASPRARPLRRRNGAG